MLDQVNYMIQIRKDKPIQEDYEGLKELGLSYVQEFSKSIWTDFNASDPGLTTLELLCYALTDLSYRTQLPLEDLLTEEGASSPFTKNNSYKAEEILVHNPLTIQDYRKLILDKHPEVRNVWFYPISTGISPEIYIHKNKKQLSLDASISLPDPKILVKGLYNVKLETIGGNVENIIQKVCNTLHSHRNLCEDFHCIDFVQFEYVTICMDLDLDGSVNPQKIKEEVYRQLYLYCAPHLKRYSLKEMLAKGYRIEEIFEGPTLENGFLDPQELEEFDKKSTLYVSDLINIFMDISGIANIRKIHLNSYAAKDDDIDLDFLLHKDKEYCLHLTDALKAFRFYIDREDKRANKINFYFDDLKLHEPDIIPESNLIPQKNTIPTIEKEWEAVHSSARQVKPYYSIQNEFPKAYLLGQEGITGLESNERKVQRLQFKGYLMLFEQMMANYLAQLHHAKKLLSWSSEADYRSYMYQALSPDEIKDLEHVTSSKYKELFDAITNNDENDDYHEQVMNISSQENFDRRNRFLNHLIARFNDSFVEFSIVEFFKKNNKTYGKHSIIADKKSFLRTYPKHSANRLKAMNYNAPIWNTTNVSGFEMRVAKKLGLTNYLTSNSDLVFRHSIAHPVLNLENLDNTSVNDFYNYNDENFDRQFGFHVLEHLLLRPKSTSDDLLPICNEFEENILNCSCNDPYSFRMTVVLPGWLPITLNEGFRDFVERVMREELPAHLAIKLCWVGPEQMLEFERCYFNYCRYLEQDLLLDCRFTANSKNKPLSDLLNILNELDNVYYPSYLVDCEDINYDTITNEVSKHPSILGRTKLNSKLSFGVNWIKSIKPVYERYEEFDNVICYKEDEGEIKLTHNRIKFRIEGFPSFNLKKSTKKRVDGKITLNNNKSLQAFVSEEEVITSIRLRDEETKEDDIIWIFFNFNKVQINLNRQLDFEFKIDEVSNAEDAYDFKIKLASQPEKFFKVRQIISRPDLRQHELEKLWLEKQLDPLYATPIAQELELGEFLNTLLQEVKTRKIKRSNF